MIVPFKLRIPNKTLNKIYKKVKKYPWSEIENMSGWEHGTNLKYLKEISKYWIKNFNWKKN
jgi:microsomal epoxide hydrolase